MNCRDFHIYSSLYIDGMLSQEEALDFEEHINTCRYCKVAFENLKTIVESTNEIEEVELPENFSTELRAKLEAEKASKDRKVLPIRRKVLTSIAACILIIFMILPIWNNSKNYEEDRNSNREMYRITAEDETSKIQMATEDSSHQLKPEMEESNKMGPRIMALDEENLNNEDLLEIQNEAENEEEKIGTFSLIIPYVLIALIGFFIYKLWKK